VLFLVLTIHEFLLSQTQLEKTFFRLSQLVSYHSSIRDKINTIIDLQLVVTVALKQSVLMHYDIQRQLDDDEILPGMVSCVSLGSREL
jgi:hypothetical protein